MTLRVATKIISRGLCDVARFTTWGRACARYRKRHGWDKWLADTEAAWVPLSDHLEVRLRELRLGVLRPDHAALLSLARRVVERPTGPPTEAEVRATAAFITDTSFGGP